MKDKKLIIVIISLLAVFLVFGTFAGYYSLGRGSETKAEAVNSRPDSQIQAKSSPETSTGQITFFSEIFKKETPDPNAPLGERVVEIILRLLLAVVFSTLLAFRPRRYLPFFQRNLYVAQTQILLAVVAAAMMMVVGDSAARAFAIFAAASLVRFRTNIRDPKEITILLISLVLGMGAGVGRWDLGLALCLFALVLLWFLEQQESEQVFRAMELTVKTRNTDRTQTILKKIFKRYKLIAEVRELDPSDEEDSNGSITYYLDLRLNLSTDYLSNRIFALDSDNIEGITWKHKREKFAG